MTASREPTAEQLALERRVRHELHDRENYKTAAFLLDDVDPDMADDLATIQLVRAVLGVGFALLAVADEVADR